MIHLVLLDTSQNKEFRREVQQWLATCDYKSHTDLQESVGMQGLADLPREAHTVHVDSACGGIYNRFARFAQTTLVCFLEDDVIPPLDAYVRLIKQFTPDVASVSAAYFKRFSPSVPVPWEWSTKGHPVDMPRGQGVTEVGGNGFGCVVLRGEILCRTVFRRGPLSYCFDHNFYKDLVYEQKRKALVDWDCVCRHHSDASVWS